MSAPGPTTPVLARAWPGLDVSGLRILVTGFGVSGYAIADQTMQRGAHVLVVDGNQTPEIRERAEILEVLGVEFRLGPESDADMLPVEEVETPNASTIQGVADYLGVPLQETAKAVFFMAGEKFVFVVIRGDLEVNETKLRNLLEEPELIPATTQQIEATELHALVAPAQAALLDPETLSEVEHRLFRLSEAIARRYFLQGAEPLRASGLTLA